MRKQIIRKIILIILRIHIIILHGFSLLKPRDMREGRQLPSYVISLTLALVLNVVPFYPHDNPLEIIPLRR